MTNPNHLTEQQAQELVESYIEKEGSITSTQEILDSGEIPRLKGYKVKPGKVSDSIFEGFSENPPLETSDHKPIRIMVRTQRISTHDITRGEIPFKDQILALNHNYMRRLLTSTIGTSQIPGSGLDDNEVVIAAENLTQIPFENVLRAYMAKSSTSTSLYQHFKNGAVEFCGHQLPDNIIPNGPLPYVMDTPSTKSAEHDESISPKELIKRGIATIPQYRQIRNSSLVAFGVIAHFLNQKGIIAVDTKTEHGINNKGEIVSQDEIWTMDSSRFWLLRDYNEQLEKLRRGETEELNPKSYSKEFARGFSRGNQGYSEEQRVKIATRYILGLQHLLGQRFEPDMRPRDERVVSGLQTIVENIAA